MAAKEVEFVDELYPITFSSCKTDDSYWTQHRREEVAWELIFIGSLAKNGLKALDREDVETDTLIDVLCRIYNKSWRAGNIAQTVYNEQHSTNAA